MVNLSYPMPQSVMLATSKDEINYLIVNEQYIVRFYPVSGISLSAPQIVVHSKRWDGSNSDSIRSNNFDFRFRFDFDLDLSVSILFVTSTTTTIFLNLLDPA